MHYHNESHRAAEQASNPTMKPGDDRALPPDGNPAPHRFTISPFRAALRPPPGPRQLAHPYGWAQPTRGDFEEISG